MRRACSGIGSSLLVACVLGLAACGEEPQQVSHKRTDASAWQGGDAAFTAGNWKQGDRASWEEQMKARNQNQNEYTRAR